MAASKEAGRPVATSNSRILCTSKQKPKIFMLIIQLHLKMAMDTCHSQPWRCGWYSAPSEPAGRMSLNNNTPYGVINEVVKDFRCPALSV